MPHVQAACGAEHSLLRVIEADVRDAALVIEMEWTGGRADPDEVRAEASGWSFAEHTTHVRQRSSTGMTEFEIVTGATEDESPFRPHEHLVCLRIRRA